MATGIVDFRILQLSSDHVGDVETLDWADLARVLPHAHGDALLAATRPGRVAWVALTFYDAPFGMIALRETPRGGLEITRFCVDQAYLHTQIVDSLIDRSHHWVQDAGYQFIEFSTHEAMPVITDALRRNGYTERETVDGERSAQYRYFYQCFVRNIGARIAGPEIPRGIEPDLVVVVERPRGYVEGWHWDAESSSFVLSEYYDRPVPVNYGFIPSYWNPADGDYLDVIVLDDARMSLGDIVVCRPIGVLRRPDGDHKLLAIPVGGAKIPVDVDTAYRNRVEHWWRVGNRPISWDGPEAIGALLAVCTRIEE